jgi:imidazole glycerol-phosphate synthase subunit HisH
MIAILEYNAGNTRSVINAVTRQGYICKITDNKKELMNAEKIIIPGVGEAASAMKWLRENELDKLITSLQQPVLGICLGLQLMCRFSEEGNTECLGIFDSNVRRFAPLDKVPHMGWNNFQSVSGSIFKGISASDNVYYVHSYYAEISRHTLAVCDYILPFSAAMRKDNFFATQFHPEKSADTGTKILKNFLEL